MKKAKTYVPEVLQEPEPQPKLELIECWAIGQEDKIGAFAMSYGPFSSEKECLETVGERGYRILHYNPRGAVEITWGWHNNRWVRFNQPIIIEKPF